MAGNNVAAGSSPRNLDNGREMKVNTREEGILPESGLAIAATVETMVRGAAAFILAVRQRQQKTGTLHETLQQHSHH